MYQLLSASRRLNRVWRCWWIWLGIALICLPTRVPPRKGVRNRRLYRHIFTLKLRDGTRIRCRLEEIYPIYEVFGRQIYDVPEIKWKMARQVVDIGANIGSATIWACYQSPTAQVLSIEPDPSVLELLRWNVKTNDFVRQVRIMDGAIAGRQGQGSLHKSGAGSPTNSVILSQDGSIHVFTLAHVIELSGDIDILKIDCEGAEFDIFRNLTPDISNRIHSIIGEYHLDFGTYHELAQELRKANFKVRDLGEVGRAGMFVAWRQGVSTNLDNS